MFRHYTIMRHVLFQTKNWKDCCNCKYINPPERLNSILKKSAENYSGSTAAFNKMSLIKVETTNLAQVVKKLYHPFAESDFYHNLFSQHLNLPALIVKHLKALDSAVDPDNVTYPRYVHQTYSWTCIYTLMWPCHIEFHETGFSKKEAVYKARLACLLWLQSEFPDKQVTSHLVQQNCGRFSSIIENRSSIATNVGLPSHCLSGVNNQRLYHTLTRSASNYNNPLQEQQRSDGDVNENNLGISSTKKSNVKQIIGTNTTTTSTSEAAIKLFPQPKNVLHNAFDVLAKELKQKDLKLIPSYRLIKVSKHINSWNCTYNLKWPENVKFSENAPTKMEASRKAAISALCWLKSNGKINSNGLPLIFDKDTVKVLTRNDFKDFSVDNETLSKMTAITEKYTNEMLPYLMKTKSKKSETECNEFLEDKELGLKKFTRQKYRGLEAYLAKEYTPLPISQYKNDFINLLQKNRILIVKGEPGCGKSTRIPQYVLESWAKEDGLLGKPCRIVVTQPRRIAAISLAERVVSERKEQTGQTVGYHVRLKSSFSPHTGRILYCTTGILLRFIQSDPQLSNFTHVILDEAHERDVNTDLLMNLAKKALTVNPNLKLIVMSATIDTDAFQKYFDDAAVIHIPGFTYPVKSFFLDQCVKLDLSKTEKICDLPSPFVIHEDVVNTIKHIHRHKAEGAILCFLPGWEDINKIRKALPDSSDMSVFCLHSRLQDSDQYRIFTRLPAGVRKVILATNIAETSVTIDDVVYVIDTGSHKDRRFDIEKGVTCIDNHWISQASMIQRKGRAGRVQAGECYHLYTQNKAKEFDKYTIPEILRTSLTKIVLNSKVYSNNMNALEFMNQLPSPPEENAVKRAVAELKDLELLDDEECLTSLGETLSEFQLEPCLAKAMVNSVIFKCVTPVVDIITLFSAESELFTSGLTNKGEIQFIKRQYSLSSDHLALMRLFEKWLEISASGDSYKLRNFCNDTGLVTHKMALIEKLKKIHMDYLYNGLYDVLPISEKFSHNDELVKGVLFSGVGSYLYHRNWDIMKGRYKNANVLLTRGNAKATITSESVNAKRGKYLSDFLIYINETRSDLRRTTIIRECSFVPPLTILLFSNKDIVVLEVPEKSSSNQVLLTLKDTNLKLLCDKEHAKIIVDCKDAIFAAYKFYTLLLTQGADYHPKVNEYWDEILTLLSDIMNQVKIK